MIIIHNIFKDFQFFMIYSTHLVKKYFQIQNMLNFMEIIRYFSLKFITILNIIFLIKFLSAILHIKGYNL